ncbi:MAG: DEAD/DEAH box helicase [Salibacteraceae bacterium]
MQASINYFKACYQADNRETAVWDLYDRKVEHRHLYVKEELLNGEMPLLPVPHKKGEKIYEKLQLYAGEKELLYFSSVVIGPGNGNLTKSQRTCAPLFFHPASIEAKEEDYFIKVDLDRRIWNFPLLKWLQSKDWLDAGSELKLVGSLEGKADFGNIGNLVRALEQYAPGLNAEELRLYPKLYSDKRLRASIHPDEIQRWHGKVLPVGGFGLVRKPTGALGVLHELDLLGQLKDHSLPLKILLNKAASSPRMVRRGVVPVSLSQPQQNIVATASKSPLSVAIGPPGTGKSFTIAAVAVEHLSVGESVLICAKKDPAIDVLVRKIEADIGLAKVAVVGGKGNRIVPLRRMVKQLISGYPAISVSQAKAELKRQEASMVSLNKDVNAVFNRFDKEAQKDLNWGKSWSKLENRSSLHTRFKRWKLKITSPLSLMLPKVLGQWLQLQKELRHAQLEYLRLKVRYLRKREHYNNYEAFSHYYKGLMTRRLAEREAFFDKVNWESILKAFPIWLVNHTELNEALPLQKELFDLVIIDEATQCDMASVLPALQRAKRVLVVGDPNQLRHLSFVSTERQAHLRKYYGLNFKGDFIHNYREKSLLDVCLSRLERGDQVNALDEHFRSKPEIIRFSNEQFYGSNIKIMTHVPGKERDIGLRFIKVAGTRNEKGVNAREADRLLQMLQQIVERHSKYTGHAAPSIGILSPFTDQTDYLRKKLFGVIEYNDQTKHRIFIGTPYAFQGEERDIMLLSLAIDDDAHPSAWRHLNRPDVLNVAITRARDFQKVFYSFNPARLSNEWLIRKFIEQTPAVPEASGNREEFPEKDRFLEEVSGYLQGKKATVITGYRLGGGELDLVVSYQGKTKGIDLVGYPGPTFEAIPLQRYSSFLRAGLPVFPLAYSSWLFEDLQSKRQLLKWLRQ